MKEVEKQVQDTMKIVTAINEKILKDIEDGQFYNINDLADAVKDIAKAEYMLCKTQKMLKGECNVD